MPLVCLQIFTFIVKDSSSCLRHYFQKSQKKTHHTFFLNQHFLQSYNSNDTTLTYKIDALLVGECLDSLANKKVE